MLKYQTKNNIEKMGKISKKTFWMVCYSLKRYINCVLPQRKNTPPLWIDTFAPSSYKHRLLWSSFEFQQKVDTVWNYQLQSKKLQTYWHKLFLNLFIVTNWRLYVLKLLVLVKVPIPIRTSSTSLIEIFSFSSATKSRRGCTFFISHLSIHKRNDNDNDSLLF